MKIRLILRTGQQKFKVGLEHLIVPESKERWDQFERQLNYSGQVRDIFSIKINEHLLRADVTKEHPLSKLNNKNRLCPCPRVPDQGLGRICSF